MANKSNNRKWIIIGLVLLMIALMVAAYFKSKNKPRGEEVEITEVKKRTIYETVAASGKVYPETEIKISSDVSGEIVELYVEEGDSVRVGQLLAKIDPEAYFSAVERGKAGLNSTKAQLENSKSQVQSATAQKQQITAQLENARNIHNRNKQLYDDGVISSAEYEQSQSNLRQLEANLSAADASIESARRNVDAARYSVKSSEASLKELNTNLGRTSIKAPVAGVVSSLSVEQGERVVGTIQMTGTEMMRIANLSSMEVQVNVSENDILRVSLDDRAEIVVDAYLDRKFEGKVTEIANSATNSALTTSTDQVTNFKVKIRIDPNSYRDLMNSARLHPFRPGMSASVDIYTESNEGVLSIPIQSVTVREDEDEDNNDDDLQEVVFVVQQDTVEMRNVSTGIQDNEYIVIKDGLSEGEKVVEGPYKAVSKKLEGGDQVREKKKKDKKD